jgi:hypothetical protein
MNYMQPGMMDYLIIMQMMYTARPCAAIPDALDCIVFVAPPDGSLITSYTSDEPGKLQSFAAPSPPRHCRATAHQRRCAAITSSLLPAANSCRAALSYASKKNGQTAALVHLIR